MAELKPFSRKIIWAAVILVGLILGTWLYFTPAGLLGKADAVGYAVCHRISERSFHLDDRAVPLCVRCSGMYLGAFTGVLFQLGAKKKGGFPPRKFYPLMGLFILAFGVDGLNSYLHLFPNMPSLYEPQHWSRLLTGTLMGINIALIIYPTFNQTVWQEYDYSPAISRWRDLIAIILAGLVVSALAFTELSLLLYPLALISALTVVLLLTSVYSVLWILLLKRENTFTGWKSVFPVVLFGFGTTLLQIALFDLGRYLLTGSWSGFF